MDSVLNGKIAVLGLMPINKKVYINYLKPHEKVNKKAEVDTNRFKYYKLYGKKPIFYSMEYIKQTPIQDLLERDKGNQERWIKTDE
ncbi:hydrolase [Bacillus sp. 16GRE42]|uniref:hydrolase n=1 Tax=Bacillus sp. 16GRE42 TaxID=2778092 RepID=UPI001C9AF605|nr:hydrolase [Bacillus sp. 16GRE42]MBY7121785.1 hydrolase [Bacillus sp. 16GRE42]